MILLLKTGPSELCFFFLHFFYFCVSMYPLYESSAYTQF